MHCCRPLVIMSFVRWNVKSVVAFRRTPCGLALSVGASCVDLALSHSWQPNASRRAELAFTVGYLPCGTAVSCMTLAVAHGRELHCD